MAYNFPMTVRDDQTPNADTVAVSALGDEAERGYALDALGWDAVFAERFAPFAEQGLIPARVAVEYQHIYRLYAEEGELLATVSGRLRHQATSRTDYPAVGDWVGYRHVPKI